MGCCNHKDDINNDDKLTDKISVISSNKFDKKMKGCEIHLKTGEIMKEKTDCIIIGTDMYHKNRNSFNITDEDQMTLENILMEKQFTESLYSDVQFSKNQSIKGVIHIAIPIWFGGIKHEEEQIKKNLHSGIKYVLDKSFESVSISDICSGKFGIPKQNSASIICSVLAEILEKPHTVLKNIYIVLKDQETVRLYQKEFAKIKEESIRGSIRSSFHYDQQIQKQELPQENEEQVVKQQSVASSLPSRDSVHSTEDMQEPLIEPNQQLLEE